MFLESRKTGFSVEKHTANLFNTGDKVIGGRISKQMFGTDHCACSSGAQTLYRCIMCLRPRSYYSLIGLFLTHGPHSGAPFYIYTRSSLRAPKYQNRSRRDDCRQRFQTATNISNHYCQSYHYIKWITATTAPRVYHLDAIVFVESFPLFQWSLSAKGLDSIRFCDI
jgi:hypothetical protein